MTTNNIKENLDNPEELERLFREDKKSFEKEFYQIYADIEGNKLADYWNIRLNYDRPKESRIKPSGYDIFVLIVSCTIAGFLIKLPSFFSIDLKEYLFYEKNAGLIVFLGLSLYLILKRDLIKKQHIVISFVSFLLPAIYINLLPSDRGSDSMNLSYFHLPLLMWCIYGLIFIGFDTNDKKKRIDYIKYNGDLAILSAVIIISGIILAGVTIGLFRAIDIKIERFYMEYIGMWGAVSVPVVASYIIRNYPSVTNKIAPVIANIFSPLVLITLIIYLISILITGKDPYNDRDFLLIFNLMLLGVMGIIVFSISEISVNKKQRFIEASLFLLAVVTLLIDLIALSAIIYRLGEFGFTPNRTAVLGSNLLITGNLILIMVDLYKVIFKDASIMKVEATISGYLPVYAFWTLIVVFGFPLLFGLK